MDSSDPQLQGPVLHLICMKCPVLLFAHRAARDWHLQNFSLPHPIPKAGWPGAALMTWNQLLASGKPSCS